MFCAKCGKEIPQGVGFCPNCGAPVARNVMQNAQDTAQQAFGNKADGVQQNTANANPYVQQNYGGAPNYGQRPAQSANPYTQQTYGAAPQTGQPQSGQQYGGQQYGGQQYGGNPYAGQQQSYNPAYGQQGGYAAQPVKQKKSKKGLMIGIAAALVLAVAAILLFVWPGFLSGGGAAGSPEKTIKNFSKSLGKMDIDGMIECFDPASQVKLKSTMNSANLNFGGMDLSTLADMMNLEVNIEVTNVEYNSDQTKATAYVDMEMSYSFMGQSDSEKDSSSLQMVKEGSSWYIDGSQADLNSLLNGIMGGLY